MSSEPPRPPAPPTRPTEQVNAPLRPRPPVPPAEPVLAGPPPPAFPPEQRRIDPAVAALLALVALVLGGLVGYLIGKGNAEPSSRRSAQTPVTQTVTHTVVQPKVVERSHTVTTTAPATPNTADEERRTEAEVRLRKAEKENEELKRQLEGG